MSKVTLLGVFFKVASQWVFFKKKKCNQLRNQCRNIRYLPNADENFFLESGGHNNKFRIY